MLFCKAQVLTSGYFSVPVAFLWVSDQSDPRPQQVILLHTAAAPGGIYILVPFSEGSCSCGAQMLPTGGRRSNNSRAVSSVQHTVGERATSSTTLIYPSLSCCDHSPAPKPGRRSSGRWPPLSPNLSEHRERLWVKNINNVEDWTPLWDCSMKSVTNNSLSILLKSQVTCFQRLTLANLLVQSPLALQKLSIR